MGQASEPVSVSRVVTTRPKLLPAAVGRLLLARASAENRCDTLHPQRPPQSAVRGDAGVGKSTLIQRVSVKAAAKDWRVLLSTAVEAEASVIGRGERLQCGPGDLAERSADEDRGQFAAVVTEHDRKYRGNSPNRRTSTCARGAESVTMAANPRAGQRAQPEDLIDVAQVVTAYYTVEPDPDNVDQQVAFGTSGHRGSSLDAAFNEAHILATTQAIVEYRKAQGTSGPLFIGRDTHALSEPAWVSALEVLAANDVVAMIDSADRYTPTPAVSHAILAFNRGRDGDLADGIVVTPSHNPPRDGGFKYNPPNGGPADTDATGVIAARANEILRGGLTAVKRVPLARALLSAQRYDYMDAYVDGPAERGRCARHQCREDPHRRRSAGRGQCRLLGGDRRAAQPRT